MATPPRPFGNSDLDMIWQKLDAMTNTAIGQVIQNVKIFPILVPVDGTELLFTIGDIGIGKYLFVPKSLQLFLTTSPDIIDRYLILNKYLDGLPVNKLISYSNQSTPQTANSTEKYCFGKDDNIENTFSDGTNIVHSLLIPESMTLRFNGVANNDFFGVQNPSNNPATPDIWDSLFGEPIVLIGDIIKIQD